MNNTRSNASVLDKIEFGLAYASRKFYETSAAKNETVVISRNGVIMHVPAREILAELESDAQLTAYLKEGAAKYLGKTNGSEL